MTAAQKFWDKNAPVLGLLSAVALGLIILIGVKSLISYSDKQTEQKN